MKATRGKILLLGIPFGLLSFSQLSSAEEAPDAGLGNDDAGIIENGDITDQQSQIGDAIRATAGCVPDDIDSTRTNCSNATAYGLSFNDVSASLNGVEGFVLQRAGGFDVAFIVDSGVIHTFIPEADSQKMAIVVPQGEVSSYSRYPSKKRRRAVITAEANQSEDGKQGDADIQFERPDGNDFITVLANQGNASIDLGGGNIMTIPQGQGATVNLDTDEQVYLYEKDNGSKQWIVLPPENEENTNDKPTDDDSEICVDDSSGNLPAGGCQLMVNDPGEHVKPQRCYQVQKDDKVLFLGGLKTRILRAMFSGKGDDTHKLLDNLIPAIPLKPIPTKGVRQPPKRRLKEISMD